MKIFMILIAVVLMSAATCPAENPVKEAGKEVGQGLKKFGRETGTAFKEGGREVGQGFKNLGKETGKAVKEGGREAGDNARKAGRSMGDWFRGLGHSFKRFLDGRE